MFEEIEFRKQCKDNRQSSSEDPYETGSQAEIQSMLLLDIKRMYQGLIGRRGSPRNSKNDFTFMHQD